jgi:preprotein translocase subunit SecF
VDVVGPTVGRQLEVKAIEATLLSLAGMLVYLWFRFELIYGVAAVVAVFHDTLITLGAFSLLNYEISLTVIAAILTLIGYSMNDTIVVFDRIRENFEKNRRQASNITLDQAINQTLSRTIMTKVVTSIVVVALLLLGGPALRGFSEALLIGIIAGTYSSIYISSAIALSCGLKAEHVFPPVHKEAADLLP